MSTKGDSRGRSSRSGLASGGSRRSYREDMRVDGLIFADDEP